VIVRVACRDKRHGAKLRLKTNGLVPAAEAAEVVGRLKQCGISTVTVALNAANPPQYAKLMTPPEGLGFQDVCSFISAAAEENLEVECTVVSAPGVKVKAVQKVALALGARDFRIFEYSA
jgi:molybdenum cofactor biosynthesis enzyme MoaA